MKRERKHKTKNQVEVGKEERESIEKEEKEEVKKSHNYPSAIFAGS